MAEETKAAPLRTIEIKTGPFFFRVRPMPFRVWPAAGEVADFRLENDTDFAVEIRFPKDLIQYANGTPVPVPLSVPAGQPSVPLHVNVGLGPGTYEYQVQVALARGFALEAMGGSRPEIEIRR
jgi:hypothetical protein